eukprot:TRINITY_DN4887_c0_g2_i1.p1 TRINITY_DN4887_c0_g2~~TRINITY_DN4887_c0_g2_i1.p1  ORF type:complete len:215 (-),score=38.45 TRINITY_DN4887_c0_g2_i1:35-679(-)
MAGSPADFLKVLPDVLPAGEPYYFLSSKQREICLRSPALARYADLLPGWVPHRKVADALGHSHAGIENALKKLGQPYVWGTEFENVHTFWRFQEPRLRIDGRDYHGTEAYFHAQKPSPFDKALWDGPAVGQGLRDKVMQTAVEQKFKDDQLKELLLSTHPHPLLSIKPDSYWGVTPSGVGENRLANLLVKLRIQLISNGGAAASAGYAADSSLP